MPRASAIVPIFNGERTLERAVHSILGQTITDIDVYLLDDGSTDDSLDIARSLASSDSRVRLLIGERNRGIGAAMSRLAEAATSEYLIIQEQDDVSMPHRIEKQLPAIEGDSTVGVVGAIASWRNSEWTEIGKDPTFLLAGRQYPHAEELVRLLVNDGCVVANATAVIRRSIAQRVSFNGRLRSSVDWRFYIEAARHCRFVGIPEVLVEMDRSGGNLTSDREELYRWMQECLDDALASRVIDRRTWRLGRASVLARHAQARGIRTGPHLLAKSLAMAPSNPAAATVLRNWASVASRRLGR